jgi:cytoskeletal protein CcmA (bactofilin family)
MFSLSSKSGQPGQSRGRATFSFVGPEVVVTGDIATPGQLHIDGKVIGDVRCGSLTQGESGSITGNINADEARLAGLVDGAVSAGNLLLEATARITSDVLYETLTVATGAQVDGRFKRRQGDSDGSYQARALSGPTAQAGELLLGRSDEQAAEAAE